MSTGIRQPNQANATRDQSVRRWVCDCQDPPVLLATYDDSGRVNIKARDRYWHCQGRVQTICPKCGQEHVLEQLAT